MQIFIDFDGTITTIDTLNTLVRCVTDAIGKRDAFDNIWASIVHAWVADTSAFLYKHGFPQKQAGQSNEAFEKVVLDWMEAQQADEEASLARVYGSRLLQGVTPQKAEEAGRRAVAQKEVSLRDGFHQFVRGLSSKGHKPTILSVNWSRDWIRGCLGPNPSLDIVSNTIEPSTGRIINSVDGGKPFLITEDKYDAVMSRLEKPEEPFIFIGDSLTDLKCMLKSKHGIVMTDGVVRSMQLLETLLKLDYHVPFVGEEGATKARFARATNFEEIPPKLLDEWCADSS